MEWGKPRGPSGPTIDRPEQAQQWPFDSAAPTIFWRIEMTNDPAYWSNRMRLAALLPGGKALEALQGIIHDRHEAAKEYVRQQENEAGAGGPSDGGARRDPESGVGDGSVAGGQQP